MLTFKLYVRIVAPSVKLIEIHDNGSTPFNDSKHVALSLKYTVIFLTQPRSKIWVLT